MFLNFFSYVFSCIYFYLNFQLVFRFWFSPSFLPFSRFFLSFFPFSDFFVWLPPFCLFLQFFQQTLYLLVSLPCKTFLRKCLRYLLTNVNTGIFALHALIIQFAGELGVRSFTDVRISLSWNFAKLLFSRGLSAIRMKTCYF